jgi:acetoin utilization deacetylase AcuC-like enzyme
MKLNGNRKRLVVEESMHEMVWYYPEGHQAHAEYGHPERPERVDKIRSVLKEAGIWDSYPELVSIPISQDVLETIHVPEYLERLENACASGRRLDLDTYTTTASWDLALKTAGGAAAVAKSVWHREARRGFALTRPPGHHATANRGMGFCLLNNIAIATENLFQNEGAIRTAIVDLDLHHGNGTQDIFWNRDDVFYFSTHQYPHYPGSGILSEVGAGRGEGKTANFPMPPMSGDQAFKAVMNEAILPLLERYRPEMILVSYGFDTHWRDPLGNVLLSADGYHWLIAQLTSWADMNCRGRIALFLEGGYDLDAASACTMGVVSALLGREWLDPLGPSPVPEMNTWRDMLIMAKKIWRL